MRSKLYKLALWFIEKCNAEWNKYSYTEKVKSLDRLTYWNFGKYVLLYGADAEWQKFSRYDVLDNAIQRLAKYENDKDLEKEIRNKAIDDFRKEIRDWQIDIQDNEYDADKFDFVFERIYEIAEQLKGGGE